MAKRTRPPRYSVPVVEQPSITPESGLRVTLKQALVAVGVIAGAGIAYGTIKWDQAETRKNVADIKEIQKKFTEATPAALRDQDDKRAKLGEAFLASNKEIANKVGELATAVAVQQAEARATREALIKISDQLQQLNASNRNSRTR